MCLCETLINSIIKRTSTVNGNNYAESLGDCASVCDVIYITGVIVLRHMIEEIFHHEG